MPRRLRQLSDRCDEGAAAKANNGHACRHSRTVVKPSDEGETGKGALILRIDPFTRPTKTCNLTSKARRRSRAHSKHGVAHDDRAAKASSISGTSQSAHLVRLEPGADCDLALLALASTGFGQTVTAQRAKVLNILSREGASVDPNSSAFWYHVTANSTSAT